MKGSWSSGKWARNGHAIAVERVTSCYLCVASGFTREQIVTAQFPRSSIRISLSRKAC